MNTNNQRSIYSLAGACGPLLVGPIAVLIALALFAPLNVLEVWPIASGFSTWVISWSPWIVSFADSTKHPQVAVLISCLVVVLLPWASIVWMFQSFLNYSELLQRQRQNRTVRWGSALFVALILAPAVIFGVRIAFGMPGDPSWAKGFGTASRAGLAFLAAGFIYGGGMLLGGIPLLFRLLVDLDFNRER